MTKVDNPQRRLLESLFSERVFSLEKSSPLEEGLLIGNNMSGRVNGITINEVCRYGNMNLKRGSGGNKPVHFYVGNNIRDMSE